MRVLIEREEKHTHTQREVCGLLNVDLLLIGAVWMN